MIQPALEQSTMKAVAWRLIPFICLLYIFNILDRSNVGFARLRMQNDLGLSKAAFDLGFGMFYVGYLLFEVPSNLLLRRVGPRLWIARIMITWGIVSALTMFAYDQGSFYALRILLGIAEAGFFPGIILYLSYWFPDRERAKMTAFFMVAIGLSSVIGYPISGLIMDRLDRVAGLHGWQWLFLLEGVPSVLVGVMVLRCLTDYPKDAHWLSEEQRNWLVRRMEEEDLERKRRHGQDHMAAMLQPRVWLLIAIYSTVAVGSNAGGAYFPTLIKEQVIGERARNALAESNAATSSDAERESNLLVGLLGALPHLCAVLGMSLVGVSSDRTNERRFHLAVSAAIGATGWCLVALSPSPAVVLAGLCIAQTGMMSMLPVFWTLPARFLSGAAAAGGVALINSVANIGGFFGASILGHFGPWSMGAILFGGAFLTWKTPIISDEPTAETAKP